MAKQTINIGTSANDGTGSTLRAAFDITNDNFTELYDGTGGLLHKIEGTNFTGSLLVGHSTTGTLSSAEYNTGIGISALDALTSGDRNVAVGALAGTNINSATGNVLVGSNSGDALTGGSYNIAIGYHALSAEDGHGKNIAIGYRALQDQNAGADAYNIAIGHDTGKEITTGVANTIIGTFAGDALTTGGNNVAVGYQALSAEAAHGNNVAVGYQALQVLNAGNTGNNVAVGREAGKVVSTGIKNTILGSKAGDLLETGENNTIIGYNAEASSTSVNNEITFGDSNISTVRIPSDSTLKIGASGDLQLEHVSSNSFIKNTAVGDLYIENQVDDADVIFRSDDGSGGLATYFKLDGTNVRTLVSKNFNLEDDIILQIGNSQDLRLYHASSHSYISQAGAGNLYIQNEVDDKDIVFLSDDGSGGLTTYFMLDGSEVQISFSEEAVFADSKRLMFGAGGDLQIVHNGTDTQINNTTGNLQFTQLANDKDISFASDNGSGGDTIYLTLDGSDVSTIVHTIKVLMPNLPTSDPSVAGQLYTDSGVLKVSAG